MTALANENGAVPAQDDADNALAASSVGGEAPPASSADDIDAEFDDAAYRQERAEAKEAALTQARKVAMETGDWAAYEAVRASQDRDDSDVAYAERGRHLNSCREPWLLHGLPTQRGWLTPDDAAIYEHRLEVSDALYEAGWPGMDGRLLFPGFTAVDRANVTSWRPWNVKLLAAPMGDESPMYAQRLSAIAKMERFKAVLGKVADQHEARHWFYAHPFCEECFPADILTVDCYFASWMLKNGENRFPGEDWDGQVPPMPAIVDEIQFLTDEDLAERPEVEWIIDGILPDYGTGILRARDQSFKSFMALSWALQAVMDGRKVLYCVGEGVNAFSQRRDAWLEYHECDVEDLEGNLHYADRAPNLFKGDAAYEAVLARCRREQYDLVIIDTYIRAAAGSDINSQGDQSIVTARIDEIKRAIDGTVLLIAHSQKSDTDSSGSIEIEDARDFVFSMKRKGTEGRVTFEITKQKDGVETRRPIEYVTQPVGQSIVLVEAGEEGPSIMTVKDWILAALHNTKGLGPQTEADIRGWVNTNEERRRLGQQELTKSTCSSTLSRLVESGGVIKTGPRYSIGASSQEPS